MVTRVILTRLHEKKNQNFGLLACRILVHRVVTAPPNAENRVLQGIKWYIKLDLKDGYRQLPVHPSEWRTQVYALDRSEHYIDLAMPFGKANSSKIFCRWASL